MPGLSGCLIRQSPTIPVNGNFVQATSEALRIAGLFIDRILQRILLLFLSNLKL